MLLFAPKFLRGPLPRVLGPSYDSAIEIAWFAGALSLAIRGIRRGKSIAPVAAWLCLLFVAFILVTLTSAYSVPRRGRPSWRCRGPGGRTTVDPLHPAGCGEDNPGECKSDRLHELRAAG
jgi:hypothetical protein